MGLQMVIVCVGNKKVRRTLIWITAGEAGGSDDNVDMNSPERAEYEFVQPF